MGVYEESLAIRKYINRCVMPRAAPLRGSRFYKFWPQPCLVVFGSNVATPNQLTTTHTR